MRQVLFLTNPAGDLLAEVEIDEVQPWQGTQRYLGRVVTSKFPTDLAAALNEQHEIVQEGSFGLLDQAQTVVAKFQTRVCHRPGGELHPIGQFGVYENGLCTFMFPVNDDKQRVSCPCCGFLTMPSWSPGSGALCPVCCWLDEMPLSNLPPDERPLDLETARANYKSVGVAVPELRTLARAPKPEEMP